MDAWFHCENPYPFVSEEMLANQTLTPAMLRFLAACVQAKTTILISGGTGSGKTTTLNALSRFIPEEERIITIEDTAELQIDDQGFNRVGFRLTGRINQSAGEPERAQGQ